MRHRRRSPCPLPVASCVRFVVLAVAAAVPAAAEPVFVLPRPPADAFVVERNVPFAAELALDVYRPPGDAVVPVVVFVNGVGSPTLKDWAGYLAWGEVTAAAGLGSVLYQSAPDRDAEVLDRVLAWIRAEAGRRHLDPDRVVLWSSSANVRTGLPAAMDAGRAGIVGAVVYYGDADPPEIRADLPVLLVRAGVDAPELDARIDALVGRALAANAPWTIENHASGVHGFDVYDHDALTRDVVRRTLDFMRRVSEPESIAGHAAAGPEAAIAAAFARGEWETAVDGYRRLVAADPTAAESHRRLGLALLASGRPAEALVALEEAHRRGRGGIRDTVVPAAEAAARAGDVARAVHWLDLAMKTRWGPSPEEVLAAEAFAAIRDAPELRELLERHRH